MPNKTLTIAGLQMRVGDDIAANETKILDAIARAAKDKADFLLTPEGSLSGYRSEFDPADVELALKRVSAAARKAKLGLALGTCHFEAVGRRKRCFNQLRIYSPAGKYLGFHGKILLCTDVDKPGTGEMSEYAPGELQTFRAAGVRFGALICNDMWCGPHCTTIPNTHLAMQLRKMGARFILHSIHSGNDLRHAPFHETATELIARTNRVPIVAVNAAPPKGKSINARSGLIAADGTRPIKVPRRGEHYFTCKVKIG